MSAMDAALPGIPGHDAARSLRERWFAGLTWKAVALVVAMAALNTLQRIHSDRFDARWLSTFGWINAMSAIALLPSLLAVVAAYNGAPPVRGKRYPAVIAAAVLASAIGFALMVTVEWQGVSAGMQDEHLTLPGYVSRVWPRYLFMSLVIALVFVFFRTRQESELATQQAELDRESFARQMAEARLQVLQAQIEPHFLFNTLANVRRLYQTDARAGERMLDHLLRYLSVALPEMRARDTTIAREASLAASYLDIQRIRMGKRLDFAIDIPPALRETRIPPLMLLTLVENAIKHGLNPLPEGGCVRVTAEAGPGEIHLRVSDTGQGFTKSSGGGTGLANIRARLAGLYGTAASLALTLNQPHGVTATIALPLSAMPAPSPL